MHEGRLRRLHEGSEDCTRGEPAIFATFVQSSKPPIRVLRIHSRTGVSGSFPAPLSVPVEAFLAGDRAEPVLGASNLVLSSTIAVLLSAAGLTYSPDSDASCNRRAIVHGSR